MLDRALAFWCAVFCILGLDSIIQGRCQWSDQMKTGFHHGMEDRPEKVCREAIRHFRENDGTGELLVQGNSPEIIPRLKMRPVGLSVNRFVETEQDTISEVCNQYRA